MTVWIFALSAAIFSPVIEPLGITLDAAEPTVETLSTEFPDVPQPIESMRYRGIEDLFAKLQASED